MSEPRKPATSTVQCERDRLLSWLGEVLAGADGVNVYIVVEESPGARSSVQIILHDVPTPLAGLPVRHLA